MHHVEEEMFVILEGSGRYRFGESIYEVEAGDVLGAPCGGPEFAHKLTNTGGDHPQVLSDLHQRRTPTSANTRTVTSSPFTPGLPGERRASSISVEQTTLSTTGMENRTARSSRFLSSNVLNVQRLFGVVFRKHVAYVDKHYSYAHAF